MQILFLNKNDTLALSNINSAVEALKDAYHKSAAQEINIPSRHIIENPSKKALTLFMPGFIASQDNLGIKVSSIYPLNRLNGIPSVHGVILLIDSSTGKIKAIIDSSEITAIRTSAMSALATDILAKKNAETMAIIGSGKQARAHLMAICSVRKIKKVKIFSRSPENVRVFIKEMADKVSADLYNCTTLQEVLKDVDIITSTTSHNESKPLVANSLLKEPIHINAIGGSSISACEFEPSLLSKVLLVVDDKEQASKEAGEITAALKCNYISIDCINEISAITKNEMFLIKKQEITFFKNVGTAFQDLVIAKMIYNKAIENNIGYSTEYFARKD